MGPPLWGVNGCGTRSLWARAIRFPLQAFELNSRMALWLAGVHSFESAGMSGYERNFCDPADPEARGCTCVALIHGLGDDAFTWKKVLTAPSKEWKKPVRIFAFNLPHVTRYLDGDSQDL